MNKSLILDDLGLVEQAVEKIKTQTEEIEQFTVDIRAIIGRQIREGTSKSEKRRILALSVIEFINEIRQKYTIRKMPFGQESIASLPVAEFIKRHPYWKFKYRQDGLPGIGIKTATMLKEIFFTYGIRWE